jgi:hypothetical protein
MACWTRDTHMCCLEADDHGIEWVTCSTQPDWLDPIKHDHFPTEERLSLRQCKQIARAVAWAVKSVVLGVF